MIFCKLMQKLFHSLHICKDLVLVCYRNYRYPGCTTRTSVPSQPTALQKPSYKKEPYLQNKKKRLVNHHHHHHHHYPTQTHRRPTKPNTTTAQHHHHHATVRTYKKKPL